MVYSSCSQEQLLNSHLAKFRYKKKMRRRRRSRKELYLLMGSSNVKSWMVFVLLYTQMKSWGWDMLIRFLTFTKFLLCFLITYRRLHMHEHILHPPTSGSDIKIFSFLIQDDALSFIPSISLPSNAASFAFKRRFSPSDKLRLVASLCPLYSLFWWKHLICYNQFHIILWWLLYAAIGTTLIQTCGVLCTNAHMVKTTN